MPVIKREQNVTELLNNAVRQYKRIQDAKIELLNKPNEYWESQVYNAEAVSSKTRTPVHTQQQPANLFWSWLSRMQDVMLQCAMDKRLIPMCRACAVFNSNYWVRALWLLLASLATLVAVYEAPRTNFEFKTTLDLIISYLDLCVNTCFLGLSLMRFLSIPMIVRVNNAFGREVNFLELLFHTGGVFKTPIIVACLMLGISRAGMWVRLMLLCSLAPSYIEAVPHLSILLNSILGAMGSIFVTIALFFLSLMVYASFGVSLFATNDPYHFGTYGISLWTFFRLALFDNWADIWNANVMGCDKYPMENVLIDPPPGYETRVHTSYGTFHLGTCTTPLARPYVSSIVFVSFLFISAYVLVNATMAAVVIGMKGSLDAFKNETLFGQQKMDIQTEVDVVLEKSMLGRMNTGSSDEDDNKPIEAKSQSTRNKEAQEMHASLQILKSVHRIWAANDLVSMRQQDLRHLHGTLANPRRLAAEYLRISHTDNYGYVYIAFSLAVVICQLLVDIDTVKIDLCIPAFIVFQAFFSLDIIARAVSFSYFPPKSVEKKEWFWFGFGLVLAILLWLPIIFDSRQLFRSFHLLRMLGLLQYLSWIRDLELIMQAFTASFYGIVLLMVLVTILEFFFSIGGVMLFKDSDPYHFSTFPKAIRTLIQILTMDNVGDIAETNMFGCLYIGYHTGVPSYDNLCSSTSTGRGWLSPLYFAFFAITSAFIMMTALIGLIMSSMENLMEIKSAEIEIWKDVTEVAEAYEIAHCAIPWLLELFEKLDIDDNAHLTIVQLQPLLRAVDIEDEQEQFTIFVKVDRDGSGQIEFPEFCEVVSIIGLLLKKTPLAAKKLAEKDKLEAAAAGVGADVDADVDAVRSCAGSVSSAVSGAGSLELSPRVVDSNGKAKVAMAVRSSASADSCAAAEPLTVTDSETKAMVSGAGNDSILPPQPQSQPQAQPQAQTQMPRRQLNNPNLPSAGASWASMSSGGLAEGRMTPFASGYGRSFGGSTASTSVRGGCGNNPILYSQKTSAVRKALRYIRGQDRHNTINDFVHYAFNRAGIGRREDTKEKELALQEFVEEEGESESEVEKDMGKEKEVKDEADGTMLAEREQGKSRNSDNNNNNSNNNNISGGSGGDSKRSKVGDDISSDKKQSHQEVNVEAEGGDDDGFSLALPVAVAAAAESNKFGDNSSNNSHGSSSSDAGPVTTFFSEMLDMNVLLGGGKNKNQKNKPGNRGKASSARIQPVAAPAPAASVSAEGAINHHSNNVHSHELAANQRKYRDNDDSPDKHDSERRCSGSVSLDVAFTAAMRAKTNAVVLPPVKSRVSPADPAAAGSSSTNDAVQAFE